MVLILILTCQYPAMKRWSTESKTMHVNVYCTMTNLSLFMKQTLEWVLKVLLYVNNFISHSFYVLAVKLK